VHDLLAAVVIGLGGWRVASLLVAERGPFRLFVRLREVFGFTHNDNGRPTSWPATPIAEMLSCVWCTSVWTTLAMYGVWEAEHRAAMIIAAMAIAVMVEEYVGGKG